MKLSAIITGWTFTTDYVWKSSHLKMVDRADQPEPTKVVTIQQFFTDKELKFSMVAAETRQQNIHYLLSSTYSEFSWFYVV